MNAVVQSQSFEERMMTRIKDSIGELMTDEELKKILEKGVEKALFEQREVNTGYSRTFEPSLVERAVDRFLREKMNGVLDTWMNENRPKVEEVIEKVLRDGIAKIVLDSISQKFQGDMYSMQQNILSRLQP